MFGNSKRGVGRRVEPGGTMIPGRVPVAVQRHRVAVEQSGVAKAGEIFVVENGMETAKGVIFVAGFRAVGVDDRFEQAAL